MNWLREPDAEPITGYRLVSPLGTGGFGEVWKCIAPGNIYKAIKFVYGNLHSMDGDAYRAEQEKKALHQMKEVRHPFVLSIERIDEVEGELAIVMELADRSLHDLFAEYQDSGKAGIPRQELLGYMRDAADGLDYLNERHSLQHLDVKPRNLFLFGNRVKVADFGLVKNLERHSSSGLMAGVTPIYAPPETFGGKVSKFSDQYSLAIVYMELLVGKRPFNGKNIRTLALQHVSEAPDLSPLPACDRAVVARALAKNPDERFPSCSAFIRALIEADPRSVEFHLGTRPISESAPTVALPPAPDSQPDMGASQLLGKTMAQLEVGILRPTLLIGLGSFGRRALLDLRCRLLDRFGDLSQVPIFRFLYVDSDPEAVHKALHEAPEVALSSTEVFPLPLQPVANYRRRALEHLNDWLPREKLYAMPRSLQPQGSRALGRLAFHDNYLRFMTRLRRELQIATHPESLSQSVSQTGLSLHANTPQVLVLAAATGGSSGFVTDLAYAVMRQMAQQHLTVAPPTLFLFLGAPNDPATPTSELANIYATLTELNHYSDPSTTFNSQYGPDGQHFVDRSPPFAAAYLMTLDNRTPDAHRNAVAHLANYVNHELTTTLGSRLELQRQATVGASSVFRSFGTQSIWFPRGLLLRAAARTVCDKLVQEWQHPDLLGSSAEIDAVCARALTDRGLQWEQLSQQLERAAYSPEGTPSEIVARLLAEMSEDSERAEVINNPGFWAQHAVEQFEEWIGSRAAAGESSVLRRSRFSLLFMQATNSVAEEWEKLLMAHCAHLMDRPGRRLATAEEALRRMIGFCTEAAETQQSVVQQQREIVRSTREQLRAAIEQCRGGSGLARLFSGGGHRSLQHFLDQLKVFAYTRLGEDTLEAGVQFFQKLRGRLEERLGDLGFCRHRLRHLQEALAEPQQIAFDSQHSDHSPMDSPFGGDVFGSIVQGNATVHVVLPDGATTLEQAAHECVVQFGPDEYRRLDEAIQSLVLAPLGGLQLICQKNSDLDRLLSMPLIDQTTAFLGELLPMADVVEAEVSTAHRKKRSLAEQIQSFYRHAAPSISAVGDSDQKTYLLYPESTAGQQYVDAATVAIPDVQLVQGTNLVDLTICREQGYLLHSDLQPVLSLCRNAYVEHVVSPPQSPHSRFDLQEWLPLEA